MLNLSRLLEYSVHFLLNLLHVIPIVHNLIGGGEYPTLYIAAKHTALYTIYDHCYFCIRINSSGKSNLASNDVEDIDLLIIFVLIDEWLNIRSCDSYS